MLLDDAVARTPGFILPGRRVRGGGERLSPQIHRPRDGVLARNVVRELPGHLRDGALVVPLQQLGDGGEGGAGVEDGLDRVGSLAGLADDEVEGDRVDGGELGAVVEGECEGGAVDWIIEGGGYNSVSVVCVCVCVRVCVCDQCV